ncbi:MAG: hypothetical protein B6247_25905 [Candidatus Parabeggiatoa sp. nov. 2]|nr:MAG: hypothetical protein B6247_25905 [Beggiatoa sp. 4572_84]
MVIWTIWFEGHKRLTSAKVQRSETFADVEGFKLSYGPQSLAVVQTLVWQRSPNFSLAVGVQTLVWQSDTRATVINRYFVWLFGRPYLRAIKDLRRQKFRGAKLLPTWKVSN